MEAKFAGNHITEPLLTCPVQSYTVLPSDKNSRAVHTSNTLPQPKHPTYTRSHQIDHRKIDITKNSSHTHRLLSPSVLHAMEEPIKTCLLQPYDPLIPASESSEIARPVHGVQHACRTATWALALLQLGRELNNPQAVNFPDEKIPLLIQACLYHDSGREADGRDRPEWESASGNNLAEHLRNSGCSQQTAWQCAEAVRLKDLPELCGQLPDHIQTIRSLLHDADALDVMRVRTTFYMDRLDCFQRCGSETERKRVRQLAVAVCKNIDAQGDLHSDIVLQDSKQSAEGFFTCKKNYCNRIRKEWEHSPHPLCKQLLETGQQSSQLGDLLAPFQAGLEENRAPFSISQLKQLSGPLGGCDAKGTGKYRNSTDGSCWYVKGAESRECASNQVLMADLARELGVTVPTTFIHEEGGQFFVVSRWMDGLDAGRETLENLSRQQWARLLLVNVIVGNEDMLNGAWRNIEIDANGNPVMFDWDWAGLATRYQRKENEGTPWEDDFSSMPVLLKKMRDPKAPTMNSRNMHPFCQPTLASLTDEELGAELQNLFSALNPLRMNHLVEQSGFRAGDRTWLRQTLWDRIAWLATRFPDSRGGVSLSEAEYRAIEAAGTRGGWLQVNSTDIPSGQLCVEELLDSDGNPQTRMTVRLSRSATRQLSDRLAIEQGLHRLQTRIRYFNGTPKSRYSEWQDDMKALAADCSELTKALLNDRMRWRQEDQWAVDRMIEQLKSVERKARRTLNSASPREVETFPIIESTLPTPKFPGRVCTRPATEVEGVVEVAEHSHGFTKLTGEKLSYLSEMCLASLEFGKSPICPFELPAQENDSGSILFHAENLPTAQSFERKLVITHPGHSKQTVEALLRELDGLGVKTDRPAVAELENRWLNQLASYHGCQQMMNSAVKESLCDPLCLEQKRRFLADRLNLTPEQIDWESHVRIRSGRLVGYRPGLPHGIDFNPAALYCPSHNLSYASKQRGQAKMVHTMLENEASLSSFERRTDIGIVPFGASGALVRQVRQEGAGATFTRIKPRSKTVNYDDTAGLLSMQMKPSALGRLDATVFQGKASFKSQYGGLEAHRKNECQRLNTAEEYRQISSTDEAQETLFSYPLSLFDELNTLTIADTEEQQQLLRTLKKRYSHWPDGRSIEEIFRYSIHSWYYELVSYRDESKFPVAKFIRECGVDTFEYLIEHNPSMLQGKLDNLDELCITLKEDNCLSNLDFRNCSMVGTRLEGVRFQNCQFSTKQLDSAELDDITFEACSFEGECFGQSVLDNAVFTAPPQHSTAQSDRQPLTRPRNFHKFSTVPVKIATALTPLETDLIWYCG